MESRDTRVGMKNRRSKAVRKINFRQNNARTTFEGASNRSLSLTAFISIRRYIPTTARIVTCVTSGGTVTWNGDFTSFTKITASIPVHLLTFFSPAISRRTWRGELAYFSPVEEKSRRYEIRFAIQSTEV